MHFASKVASFLILFSSIANARPGVVPAPLENVIASYETELITGPRVQATFCQLAMWPQSSSFGKLAFRSWNYDAGQWTLATNGEVAAAPFESSFKDLFAAQPTMSENPAAINTMYLEVIDRSKNPIRVIPIFGTGKKNVFGVDVNMALRFRDKLVATCQGVAVPENGL